LILVISHAADEHASAVLGELERLGAPALLLDLARFPQEVGLALTYDDGRRTIELTRSDGERVSLDACGAVWWRRPQPFEIAREIRVPSHVAFAYNESQEAFAGLWQVLDAHWINHPSRDEIAARKAYQLRIAQEVGLSIPETLVTNIPERARDFAERHGCANTVYKTFSATPLEWRETRILRPEEVSLLDRVRYAPVIFQEYIPAGADVRVTVVGDALFPAEIDTPSTSYPIDFRMDMENAAITPVDLPAEVERGLRALMARLEIVYGAIDMRRTPAGLHYFLEVNPAGQWLFIEQRTGQAITAALAKLLVQMDAE
jgi:glutathione synthase/RimK-type ligase-like ATP-grasp enzyme